jgi:methylenetetrahydrofolate dehydrogenase (NADP+)/methenyltetrahydrofolate cyclohydrolase
MILDGKKIQKKRARLLKIKISKKKTKPVLVIIQIGSKKESDLYIKRKIEFGKKIGAKVEYYQLKPSVTFNFIKKLIGDFNNDPEVKGIIVQLPLPKGFDKDKILKLIYPKKDVDGLNPSSKRYGATPRGISTLLQEYKVRVKGNRVVVIGDSDLVGKPVARLLKEKGAKVTVCNEWTKNTKEKVKQADIVISAVGKPELIKKSWVKDGQVLIDVGTTFVRGKLKGDIYFEAKNNAKLKVSPVPGGVGPMTVLSLFENLLSSK